MLFSDPPFNVKIDGHVGGLGKTKHDEFAMASGEMSPAEFTGFLETAFRNAADVSIDGAIHYQCMDWRHVAEMMNAGCAAYNDFKNICIWSKDNAGMGSFYRSQHEMVFVWKVGTAPHLNTIELGKNGRYRTNIWNYAGPSRTGAHAELKLHPTVKPVPMIMDAIKDTSKRGEIVLDPFGGSGSTLIAAEKTSLIEANIQALGHGKVAHRLAAKDTLELFRRALINRERRLSDAERLRQIEAANAERARRNGFMSDDD